MANNRNYLATGAQISYLRRLLIEAFSNLYDHGTGLDHNHLEKTPRVVASAAIDFLLEGKRAGWKNGTGRGWMVLRAASDEPWVTSEAQRAGLTPKEFRTKVREEARPKQG